MANVKISDLPSASSVSRADLMMLSQTSGNSRTSVSASLGEAVAGGYIDATNITVATTDWAQQGTPDFDGYPYVATLTIQGVTTNDFAEVIPSLDAITDGKLCPLNKTVANGVNIYAVSAPSVAYTIERVSIRRANV